MIEKDALKKQQNKIFMQAQDKRQVYLDTVAGILIVYMMLMHCEQFTDTFDTEFGKILSTTFSCFMPWFFFKSGMFCKECSTVKADFKHTVKKLWRPYLLFWCIGFAIQGVFLYIDGDKNWVHYLLSPVKQTICDGGTNNSVLPMWFLVTLFGVRVLSTVVKSIGGGVDSLRHHRLRPVRLQRGRQHTPFLRGQLLPSHVLLRNGKLYERTSVRQASAYNVGHHLRRLVHLPFGG